VESLIFGFFSLYVFVLGVAGISGAGWGGGSVIRHVLLSCDIFIIPVAVRLLSKLDSTVDGECPPFFLRCSVLCAVPAVCEMWSRSPLLVRGMLVVQAIGV